MNSIVKRIERLEESLGKTRVNESFKSSALRQFALELKKTLYKGNLRYIDNGFFLDGNDSYFSMWSRLKSGERLRMTQTYALSVTLNKKVITIISINEKWGVIEKRLPCGEEKE